MTQGNNGSYQFSNKYDIPTLNSIVYTCRLHVNDMFHKMPVMASRGLINVLFNLFILLHCFLVLLLLLSYHSILGSDLGCWPKKVLQSWGHWHNTGKLGL